MMNRPSILLLSTMVLPLLSFDNLSAGPLTNSLSPQPEQGQLIENAVTSQERPANDKALDVTRKPQEVLQFLGLKKGDNVLDLLSGGGYYTEIMSRAVGPKGHVTAHNNSVFLDISERALETRYQANRLENVTPMQVEVDDLTANTETYDFVLMALVYHDFFLDNASWPGVDVPRLLREVYSGLKSGGIVGIIDHAAAEGTGVRSSNRLHRIEPAFVRRQMEEAGFVFAGESDLLANSDDPKDIPMWDPSVRRRTDRFIMKFKKP